MCAHLKKKYIFSCLLLLLAFSISTYNKCHVYILSNACQLKNQLLLSIEEPLFISADLTETPRGSPVQYYGNISLYILLHNVYIQVCTYVHVLGWMKFTLNKIKSKYTEGREKQSKNPWM